MSESLWICLICGFIGCGRYTVGRHSLEHNEVTRHNFAIELTSNRIWNYSGDCYVHRILKTNLNLIKDETQKELLDRIATRQEGLTRQQEERKQLADDDDMPPASMLKLQKKASNISDGKRNTSSGGKTVQMSFPE